MKRKKNDFCNLNSEVIVLLFLLCRYIAVLPKKGDKRLEKRFISCKTNHSKVIFVFENYEWNNLMTLLFHCYLDNAPRHSMVTFAPSQNLFMFVHEIVLLLDVFTIATSSSCIMTSSTSTSSIDHAISLFSTREENRHVSSAFSPCTVKNNLKGFV